MVKELHLSALLQQLNFIWLLLSFMWIIMSLSEEKAKNLFHPETMYQLPPYHIINRPNKLFEICTSNLSSLIKITEACHGEKTQSLLVHKSLLAWRWLESSYNVSLSLLDIAVDKECPQICKCELTVPKSCREEKKLSKPRFPIDLLMLELSAAIFSKPGFAELS